jgi:hypothetical protein
MTGFGSPVQNQKRQKGLCIYGEVVEMASDKFYGGRALIARGGFG